MSILLTVKYRFKRSLKNKRKLILTFLMPFISIILAIGVNVLMKPQVNIGILNNRYTNKEVVKVLKDMKEVNLYNADKSSINTDLILGKYISTIEFNRNNKIKIYLLDEDIKLAVEKTVYEIKESNKSENLKLFFEKLNKSSLSTAQRSSGFIFLTLMITSTIISASLLKDKEDNILKRYVITPNKLYSYILGNFVYNIIFGILQILLSSVVLVSLNINLNISIGQFILIGIFISIISSVLSIIITIISDSELQASLLSSSFALIISLLGGVFIPVEKMPKFLQYISNISITKYILNFTKDMEDGILNINFEIFIIILLCLFISILYIFNEYINKKLLNLE